MSFGKGMAYSCSRKQNLNTISSTEAKLVGTSNILPMIIWVRIFLDVQDLDVKLSTLNQDNKSTIQLILNDRLSSSKSTRYIGIRFSFIKDRVDKGEIEVVFCLTERMLADFVTKLLQGCAFIRMRDVMMGISDLSFLFVSKEGTGIRVKHVVTRDEIVRKELSENADEASKNADKALKNPDVSVLFPVNHRNLHSAVTMAHQKSYKEAPIGIKGTK